MGMPASVYRCHGCQFSATLLHGSIKLRYTLPDGRSLEMGRQIGWCANCQTLRDIEPYFDSSEISSRLSENKPGFLAGLFGRAKARLDPLERDRLMLALLIARSRESEPRCLKCWSPGASRIDCFEDGNTTFTHKCGSKLYLVPGNRAAARFSLKPIVIDLDVEGQPIARQRVVSIDEEAVVPRALGRNPAPINHLDEVGTLLTKFSRGEELSRNDFRHLALHCTESRVVMDVVSAINGDSLLHACARLGLHEECGVLLRNGADAGKPNGYGERPFMVAEGFIVKKMLSDATNVLRGDQLGPKQPFPERKQ